MSARSVGMEFGSILVQTHLLEPSGTVRVGGADELQLIAVRQGSLSLVSSVGACPLRAGEAVLSLAEVFCEAEDDASAEIMTVTGPGELARDMHESLTSSPQVLPGASALLAPTLAFALRTLQPAGAGRSKLGDYYIERLLQEMMQGLLTDTSPTERTPRLRQDPYRQAVAVLAAQFTDAELTSDGVAEAVNLSRRQLEREFSKRGTTIRGELRRLRVERAVSMLGDADYALLTVDQVARHVGFSGASSLARAMAQEGYHAPSKLRALCAAARPEIREAIPNAS